MTTTIVDVEFFLVEIGCEGREPPIRSLLVRLVGNRGLEGWGETSTTWTAMELPGRRDVLLSVLGGRSIFEIEDLLALPALRMASLRSAVEMACWDLIGRTVRQPLCHLFGGGYRSRVPLAIRLTGTSLREIATQARELDEQGFHAQVIPTSGRVECDLEIVAAVREVLPPRAELRFDGGGCYDMESARDLCGQLEPVEPQFVLDPLATRNLDQVASLRRQTSVPLAVRRAVQSPADVLALVRCEAASFAVIDLQCVGGLLPARKCAAVAQAAGLYASLAAGPSLGIALAAMLQIAAATPTYSNHNECPHHHLQDDVLVEPLVIADGMLAVPQGFGLGIEVDRGKVERYQIA
jgi:L-alanine-DL-glutamate epimerase-like enolase superfamily enzyme